MFLDSNDRAALKTRPVQSDRPSHESDVPFRANLLDAELNDAGGWKGMDHQCSPEVQIAGKNHRLMLTGPRHDRIIGGILRADLAPMDCIDARQLQRRNPVRREIHVDDQLHPATARSISRN